jgi:hypothetical protein
MTTIANTQRDIQPNSARIGKNWIAFLRDWLEIGQHVAQFAA